MTKCAYPRGCSNPAPKNQKYCSREHSPFGHLCKENYIPPRKGRSIYKTQEETTAPKSKREIRRYSRDPKPEDFVDERQEDCD